MENMFDQVFKQCFLLGSRKDGKVIGIDGKSWNCIGKSDCDGLPSAMAAAAKLKQKLTVKGAVFQQPDDCVLQNAHGSGDILADLADRFQNR